MKGYISDWNVSNFDLNNSLGLRFDFSNSVQPKPHRKEITILRAQAENLKGLRKSPHLDTWLVTQKTAPWLGLHSVSWRAGSKSSYTESTPGQHLWRLPIISAAGRLRQEGQGLKGHRASRGGEGGGGRARPERDSPQRVIKVTNYAKTSTSRWEVILFCQTAAPTSGTSQPSEYRCQVVANRLH